jgi:hypothetical protein
MDAANALISGLSGEKIRWTQQSQEFTGALCSRVTFGMTLVA